MEVEAARRKVTSVACGEFTRPSWTTAHCTRSVMAALVDLGMEISAAGIAEARGGGGVQGRKVTSVACGYRHTAVV